VAKSGVHQRAEEEMIIVKRIRVHLIRMLVAVAALAATAISTLPASAHAVPRADGRAPGVQNGQVLPSLILSAWEAAMFPLERMEQRTVTSASTCPVVDAELSWLARAGLSTVECVVPWPAHAPRRTITTVAARVGAVPDVKVLEKTTRHKLFDLENFGFELVQVPSGKVLGTGIIVVAYQEILNATSRNWTLSAAIELAPNATGAARTGTAATTEINCAGGCSSSPSWIQPLAVGVTYSHNFAIDSPGTRTDTTSRDPIITLTNPVTQNPGSINVGSLGPARCDSIAYAGTSGCVFADIAAAYYVYLTNHNEDQVARNILKGEQSKRHHFGWYQHGSPVRRAISPVVAKQNRDVACKVRITTSHGAATNTHSPRPSRGRGTTLVTT
jgi:hypothetical protein